MALWTPYADSLAILKSESDTNNRPFSDRNSSSPSKNETCNEFSHHYPQNPFLVPSASTSPVSSSSSSRTSPSSLQNSLSLPSNLSGAAESLLNDEEYKAFEDDAFTVKAAQNGGSLLVSNPRMRRAVQSNPTADDLYRKQREKNNLAAKQSRDRRKLLEFRLEIQLKYLRRKLNEVRTMSSAGVCVQCKRVK